jgi:hypothetical protein
MTRAMTLHPYQPGDERAFTPRADFAEELPALMAAWVAAGPASITWTLTGGASEVLGVAGAAPLEGERWGVWALLADLSRRQWLTALKWADEALTSLERFRGARVIEATARVSNPAAIRTLERLGFRATGRIETDPGLGVAYAYFVREVA